MRCGREPEAGLSFLEFLIHLIHYMDGGFQVVGREKQAAFELMAFSPLGFDVKEGVVPWQYREVHSFKGQFVGIEKDIEKPQLLRVLIAVGHGRIDDKDIPRCQSPGILRSDMKSVPTDDNDDFREFMGVDSEGFLGIFPLDGNRESIGMKTVFLFEYRYHVQIVL